MNCNSARKILYTSEYPEVVKNETVEARRHVNRCYECKEFMEGEERFASTLRNSFKREVVPEELKNLILNKKKDKRLPFIGIYKGVALAASILILVIAGYLFLQNYNKDSFLQIIVQDHVKFMPSPGKQINTSDPRELKSWFRGRVDFPVSAENIKARLIGGRLCSINKRRAALLFYKYKNTPLSLYIIKGSAPYEFKSMKEVVLRDKEVRYKNLNGYTIVLWCEKGLTCALVSELDLVEIRNII